MFYTAIHLYLALIGGGDASLYRTGPWYSMEYVRGRGLSWKCPHSVFVLPGPVFIVRVIARHIALALLCGTPAGGSPEKLIVNRQVYPSLTFVV